MRFSPARPNEAPSEYAKRLVEEAKQFGDDVEGELEGARVTATPKMAYEDVFEGWSRRRREIARRGFDEELASLARLLVGKKVISVSAEFEPHYGPDRLTIAVDDGSRLTVHGNVFAMWRGNNKTPSPTGGNC